MSPISRAVLVSLVAASAMGSDCGPRRSYPAVPAYPDPVAVATTPVVCGDGILAQGEACDDGNTAPGDGCDACRLELPQCAPGTDGVVWQWRCDGSPSRCALATCEAGACPPELATRTLTAAVRLEGFLDARAADTSRIHGAGLDCRCRDTLAGRRCEGTCTAQVPTCTRTTLAAASTTATMQRWAWGCSGTTEQCAIRTDIDTTIEAQLAAAPIHVAGVARLDTSIAVLATDGPNDSVLVSHGTRISVVTPSGEIASTRDFGDATLTVAHRAVFTTGGYWLAWSTGDERGYTKTLDDDPIYFVTRYDFAGASSATLTLGHLTEPPQLAALPEGGVAVAYRPTVRAHSDGTAYWRATGVAVTTADASGLVRTVTRDTTDIRTYTIRAVGRRVVMAGTRIRDGQQELFVDRHTWQADPYLVVYGLALVDGGDAIALTGKDQTLTLARYKLDGALAWSRALSPGRVDVGAMVGSGDRVAWFTREPDETGDTGHGHYVVRVVDGAGTYLHAWSIPLRAPARFDGRLAGLTRENRAILAGSVTGPQTIGHVRFAGTTQSLLWLDPRPVRTTAARL